jgi:uncharacterized protein YbcI
MPSEEPVASLEAMQTEIAAEVLRVHEENYGTGASNVDVHLVGDIVLVVLDVDLTTAERTLMTSGHVEAVKKTRESFQQAIAPTFAAIVERATGRKVRSFLSSLSTEPLYATELFRLDRPPAL